MSETRKIAAILAADVVGYSRLMGEDEAGGRRAVRERREATQPILTNLGGRIAKTTGPGGMTAFCAHQTAGVDVQRTEIATVDVAVGRKIAGRSA